MRKIDKSVAIPSTLREASVPTSTDEVKDTIYKASDVRDQLLSDQAYKCAYCECSLSRQYNDVEHYRPKSRYYWLGHRWDNLLYLCDLCNRTYKKANFPLQDELERVTSPGSVAKERPLIINPAEIDPSNHIRFRRHIMVGLTPEGTKTIEIFHLNDRAERPDLINNREQLFEEYEIAIAQLRKTEELLAKPNLSNDIIEGLNEVIELTKKSISQLTSYSKAYSGMLISQI